MKIIDIKRTDKTPEITLDTEKRLFQIKGNCLPENISNLSNMVLEKFDEYFDNLIVTSSGDHNESGAFRVHFRMGYFNSAAAKFLADLLMNIGDYVKRGCNIKVYWYFDEDDHDMLEAGEEIAQMVNVPMEYITVLKEI